MQLTERQMLWRIPLARANAWLHAAMIADGHLTTWPDPRHTRRGRMVLAQSAAFRARRAQRQPRH